MRHITVRQLQIFTEAAAAPSLARVAERLHITPAAVSFQLKQIESMTGFALFERTGRATRLTDAGATLLGYARSMLQSLEDADQALTALRGSTTGKITLGLVSTAKYFVPHMIAAFNAEHPGIRIHLRDGNRREILAGIQSGELDLAISGRPPEDEPVSAEAFAPHPSVVIAKPDHPLTRHERLPPSVVIGEPFIIREDGSGTRKLMETFFGEAGLSLRVVMTTSSNEMIKQAVMAGMGLALISRHTIGLELGLGLLATLPLDGFPLMRSWFVVRRAGKPMLPVHERLRTFVLQNGQAIIDRLEQVHAHVGTNRAAGRQAGMSEQREPAI